MNLKHFSSVKEYITRDLLFLFLSIMGSMLFSSCGNNTENANVAEVAPPAPAFPVFKVIEKTTTLHTSYPATLQGQQNIEIRPKIEGFIEHIYIDEGQAVKKGQLLFRIRAPQYQQEVNNAAAAINSAKADVSAAELQAKKIKPLVDKEIISDYELESAEYTLQMRKSALAQANANLANAKTNLGYTSITSPVNGVVGLLPYKLGSLVTLNTAQPLTTVSNITNVYAYFSLNEKQLLEFSRQYEGSTLQAKLSKMPPVSMLLSDGSIYPEKGRIESIGGMINTETGSISFRATFPNPVGLLRSGGSATVQVPLSVTNAILIPQRSTYELQGKRFVYRVDANNKVISTEIEVMNLAAGQYLIVTKGLKAGDMLVLESAAPLPDSTTIKPDIQPESKVYEN